MNETSVLLSNTCNQIFSDFVTPSVLDDAEDGKWPQKLWANMEENGLTTPFINEEGSVPSLTWQEVFTIFYHAGYYCVPLPLVENVIANWVLSQLDGVFSRSLITLQDGDEILTIHGSESNKKVSGSIKSVPWGSSATYLLAVGEYKNIKKFILLDISTILKKVDVNIAGESRDAIELNSVVPEYIFDIPEEIGHQVIKLLPALGYSAKMSGAISSVLDLSVEYVGDRVQFGRSLSKFQAIQQQLAILASEAAAAQTASINACKAVDSTENFNDIELEVAVAKVRSGDAAGKAAAIAHQVHGAIGFTYEFKLHYLTRRLWSWRSEFGSESYWSTRIGRMVMDQDVDCLWPNITSRM